MLERQAIVLRTEPLVGKFVATARDHKYFQVE